MRTSVLISRIGRLIETAGDDTPESATFGDGAELAEEYAAKVNEANKRLEAVIAAADSRSIGDAIRILSEEPSLLEEVSALDFIQFPDWENLCAMNGWHTPPKIDRKMTQRAVAIGETKDAISPFLSMYKKAIRVNNMRLAVKSLRRLVDLDHSQNWTENLRQSERRLQSLIVDEFRAARKDGKTDVCERLAQELLDGTWKEGLTVTGVDEIKAYLRQREAERREIEGREDLEILRLCLNGKWNRKLASSLVRSIDGFLAKNWTISVEDRRIVEACRMRCAKEIEQEVAENRWRGANENLHAAIQKEDCAAIRAALASPEFLDRDPREDLLKQARGFLEQTEAARRRRRVQIIVGSLLVVLVVLSISGCWLRQRSILRRCENEARDLAYLEVQAKDRPHYAIERITSTLARLKAEEPAVYSDSKINQFETRLQTLVANNRERTNQLSLAIDELEWMRERNWTNGVGAASVEGTIAKVESLLSKDDNISRSRFLELKESWVDYCKRETTKCRNRAENFLKTLVSHLGIITNRLKSELAKDELNREVQNCRDTIGEWKSVHGQYAEDLTDQLAESEKAFNDAIEEQEKYTEALKRLIAATNAVDILEAREEIVYIYGNYAETRFLKPMDIELEEVKDILSPCPTAIQDYLKDGISQEEFQKFIKEKVSVIADSPEYYSLYGIIQGGDYTRKVIAISEGRPDINRPDYERRWQASNGKGRVLDVARCTMVSKMGVGDRKSRAFLMPSSDEMRTVVEITEREQLSPASFEREILRLIENHLAASHKPGYVAEQEQMAKNYNPTEEWWSPYRRVQFLSWYMRWLKDDLKLMPNDRKITDWYEELDKLATDVAVDGVDESLSWICIGDPRIRRRTIECAKLLNRMPPDWVDRYRTLREEKKCFSAISGWKIVPAGKVIFDPFTTSYQENSNNVEVLAAHVSNDHPLYALRKQEGRTVLLRAFEQGKSCRWRKCAEVEQSKDGYILGEPLYHVMSSERYIDVKKELLEMASRVGIKKNDPRFLQIPIYWNGGK